MENCVFYSPTKVFLGRETHLAVGENIKLCGAKKVLVHYGSDRVIKTGLMGQVEDSLKEAGLSYVMLGGVVPNPHVALVRKGAELVRAEGVDFILAVGGGSVIDSAKGIAMAAVHDCDIWDIFTGKAAPQAAIPTANILTLAAAGSETSEHAVLTNEDGWIKIGFHYEKLRPAFSIMNPELLFSLPPYQTAAGAVDIMMHTLDRYFSPGAYTEMTDRIAEQVLKVTIEFGSRCMQDPNDYDARAELMWAGSLSHNDLTGLGRPGDWAPHMLEHELSGKFNVTHGAGLAAIWPTWARYVYKEDVMRFARYGMNVWGLALDFLKPENTALEAIRRTEEFFISIGMPVNIKDLIGKTITDADIADMADKCTGRGANTIGSFKALNRACAAEIYKLARG